MKIQTYIDKIPELMTRLAPLGQRDGAGIYVMMENGKPVYVGRTRRVRGRMRSHCRPTSKGNAFAFRLARAARGNLKATYKKGDGSRTHLRADTAFAAALVDACDRISRMDVHFVEISCPILRYLFELHYALEHELSLDEFDTH
jgi:hypothetical protein